MIGLRELAQARYALSTLREGVLDAVCIGTPQFSLREFERLTKMLVGEKVHPNVRFHVSTSRFVLAEIEARDGATLWNAPGWSCSSTRARTSRSPRPEVPARS